MDALTGLLDRRSFLTRAHERLQTPGQYELIVADLDRLRRLNATLGTSAPTWCWRPWARVWLPLSRRTPFWPASAKTSLLPRFGGRSPDPRFCVRLWNSRCAWQDLIFTPPCPSGRSEATGGEEAPEAAELLRRGELAVEAARSNGRGVAAAYGRGLESDGHLRLALEGDLKGALGPR